MSILNDMKGAKDFKIFACPKCGKIPSVKRSPDPAEIDKRYSVTCTTEGCAINKKVYGTTETSAIVEWNRFASKVVCPKTATEDYIRN